MKLTGKRFAAAATKALAASLMVLASACTQEEGVDAEAPIPFVNGTVTDMDGNPIEHIKIVLEWQENEFIDEVYSTSEGRFRSEEHMASEGPTRLKVTLEDIDGESNGGLFETYTETFIGYPDEENIEPESVRFDLAFRLNRATASESSPQS